MKKLTDKLFKTIEILIAVFLACMILLLFMNVVLRYVFNTGFVWSEEIARLCFIYLVYLGAIEAARDNRHLLIDSLLLKLPKVFQKIIYTLVQICTVWLMVILVRGSWGLVIQNLHDKWVATHFPTYLVYAAGLITGCAIIVISLISMFRLFILKIPVAELVSVSEEERNEEIAASAE